MIKHFHNKTSLYNRGQILLVTVILFTLIITTIVFAGVSPIIRQISIVRDFEISQRSYFAAEAGSEDAYYRIKNNLNISFPQVLLLDDASATITISTVGSNEQEILSTAVTRNLVRSVLKNITVTDGFAFNFAVQVGQGGLRMQNDSDVIGNVYSDGPIQGDDKNKNFILGDAVSAGEAGSIKNIYASSSAYANNIADSRVGKDAYYKTINNTTVSGIKYPNSSSQPTISMPISDSLLDQWENNALAGGVITSPCPYTISANATLGPVKINCDLVIGGNNTTVTLTGAVWVNGNVSINGDPAFRVSNTVGNKSVSIIAHSTSNPLNKGIFNISNNPTFFGSTSGGVPNPDSYIMFISRNTSGESGGAVQAISVGNNVTGKLLLYAPLGAIFLSNNVVLYGVTGYSLVLKNNTQVYYSTGLAHPLFVSGPGGKWKIRRWKEAK